MPTERIGTFATYTHVQSSRLNSVVVGQGIVRLLGSLIFDD